MLLFEIMHEEADRVQSSATIRLFWLELYEILQSTLRHGKKMGLKIIHFNEELDGNSTHPQQFFGGVWEWCQKVAREQFLWSLGADQLPSFFSYNVYC